MTKPLPVFKDFALRDDAFGPGHSLCPGCEEAVTFHTLGRATDDGHKTVLVMGTSCGEVSTLMYPNTIAWGRGEREPEEHAKSLGVIHHVFESAPTVAEGARDVADTLADLGAWRAPAPHVISWSGDGGALAIGLRSLLHAIYRKARIAIFVNVNEVFANTGFQYSPTSLPYADSSTLPLGGAAEPIDFIGLTLVAGAAYVAQASPGTAPFFADVVRDALACDNGTAIVFVPSPCIAGWKFEEGMTAELGKLAAQTGLFPAFRKRAGQPGEVKIPDKRPPVTEWLSLQRRFEHLVRTVDGKPQVVTGREPEVARLQAYADANVARLRRWAVW